MKEFKDLQRLAASRHVNRLGRLDHITPPAGFKCEAVRVFIFEAALLLVVLISCLFIE